MGNNLTFGQQDRAAPRFLGTSSLNEGVTDPALQ